MTKKKTLVWLASYPKSGNTWLRGFLANYILDLPDPVPINEIPRLGTGDSLAPHYIQLSGGRVHPEDDAAVLRLRPTLLERMATNGADVNLIKSHNKNAKILGTTLIPAPLTRRAIYIIRHPYDMLASYADHYGLSPDDAAMRISRSDNTILPDRTVVRQFVGGWSEHVKSWTRNAGFPVTILKYEDMAAQPEEAFAKVVRDLGAPLDRKKLLKAIDFSSFERLRKQEDEHGFMETSTSGTRFFRTGRVGVGGASLPAEVRERIAADHGPTMKHFGYEI